MPGRILFRIPALVDDAVFKAQLGGGLHELLGILGVGTAGVAVVGQPGPGGAAGLDVAGVGVELGVGVGVDLIDVVVVDQGVQVLRVVYKPPAGGDVPGRGIALVVRPGDVGLVNAVSLGFQIDLGEGGRDAALHNGDVAGRIAQFGGHGNIDMLGNRFRRIQLLDLRLGVPVVFTGPDRIDGGGENELGQLVGDGAVDARLAGETVTEGHAVVIGADVQIVVLPILLQGEGGQQALVLDLGLVAQQGDGAVGDLFHRSALDGAAVAVCRAVDDRAQGGALDQGRCFAALGNDFQVAVDRFFCGGDHFT